MYCMKCGRQLKDDDRFCEGCGTPVAPDAPPPPEATVAGSLPAVDAAAESAPVSRPAVPVAAPPAPRKRRLGPVIALVVLALVVVAAAAVFAVPMLLRTAPSTVTIGGNTGTLGFDTDSPGAPSTRIQSVGSPSSQSGMTTPSVTPSGTP